MDVPIMAAEKPASPPVISFKGSCACGRMTYDCAEPPFSSSACHCNTCRKLSGGPYQAFVDVISKSVTFYDNAEHLRYEGLPKDNIGGITFLRFSKVSERAFCASCHSPLAMRYKLEYDTIGLTLGSVDEESMGNEKVKEAFKLQQHIFVSQKAWWYDVEKDDLPCEDRFTGHFEEDMKAWEGKGR